MATIAYVTDIEGLWPKFAAFLHRNPVVRLCGENQRGEYLQVNPDCMFVFGGDTVDRGPAALRLLRLLVDVKQRQPEQVVLLAGNRDINKLRLLHEVAPSPADRVLPPPTPAELREASRAELLPWILTHTMSAKLAFGCRQQELAHNGAACDAAAVADSLIADVSADGLLLRYLKLAQLMYRHQRTLFVHGAVTAANFGLTPTQPGRTTDVTQWQHDLNGFFAQALAAADRGEHAGYAPLVAYQAPLAGKKLNQSSVVYARPTDDCFNPQLPPAAVVAALVAQGIDRLVVGHSPIGDTPSLIRSADFELILADNSYSRLEHGAQLLLDGTSAQWTGRARLDDGSEHAIATCHRSGDGGPLGTLDAQTGGLCAARLADGRYLLSRGLPSWQRSQVAAVPMQWAVPVPMVDEAGQVRMGP